MCGGVSRSLASLCVAAREEEEEEEEKEAVLSNFGQHFPPSPPPPRRREGKSIENKSARLARYSFFPRHSFIPPLHGGSSPLTSLSCAGTSNGGAQHFPLGLR